MFYEDDDEHDYDDENDDDDDADAAPLIPIGYRTLDEIEGETRTTWLWPEKIPLGHVTVLAGEAGSGKSLLAAEIAAHASSGAGWGDGAAPAIAGPVLFAHANQHENLTLKRRLLAAGAVAARVNVVNRDVFERNGDVEDGWAADESPRAASLSALEGAFVGLRGAPLLVIDHLLGWLGKARVPPDELNPVFKTLADMAARYRVAVVVLWRLEKGSRAAQTRALDELSAAAPVVWLLANDTYDAQARLAVCAHNRLGVQSESMAFRLADDHLVWQQAPRQVSPDDMLAARTPDRTERRQAGQWLLDLLSRGPIEAQRLFDEARQCGLAERTLRRAAAELGLHPTKDGKRNVWLWGECLMAEEGSGVGTEGSGFRVQGSGDSAGGAIDGDSSVARVESSPDAPQNVAALPSVGSLAGESSVARGESSPDAPQNVAALPPVGSLAPTAAVPPDAGAAQAAPAVDGDEASKRSAASAKRERREARRESRFIERTLAICRGE